MWTWLLASRETRSRGLRQCLSVSRVFCAMYAFLRSLRVRFTHLPMQSTTGWSSSSTKPPVVTSSETLPHRFHPRVFLLCIQLPGVDWSCYRRADGNLFFSFGSFQEAMSTNITSHCIIFQETQATEIRLFELQESSRFSSPSLSEEITPSIANGRRSSDLRIGFIAAVCASSGGPCPRKKPVHWTS